MGTAFKIPKVSVCVVTYNQEKYIRQCLQSIIDQETNFNIEVIVADDCSTDKTQSIIQEFATKYSLIFKTIFHKKNIGPFKNYIAAHGIACGEYITHIDGDDFFAPRKLSEQSSYLDTNPDCIAVVHKLKICDHNREIFSNTWPKNFSNKKYDLEKLVKNHPDFGHSSLMYKNGAIKPFLCNEFPRFIDFQIYVHLTSKGLIGTIDSELGFYTRGIGISSSKNLYELAIQALSYATELGLSKDVCQYAAARQYHLFAKKALMDGDSELFINLISCSIKAHHISLQQITLYVISRSKFLHKIAKVIIITKRFLKNRDASKVK